MSEKPRRAASQSKGPNKSGPADNGEPFPSRLIKAANDFGNLLQDAGGLQNLASLIKERDTLQEGLEQKEVEIERLRNEMRQTEHRHGEEMSKLKQEKMKIESAIEVMITEIGVRYKKWDKETGNCANQAAELARLKSDLDRAQEKVTVLSSDNGTLRGEKEQLEGEFGEAQDSLKKLSSKLQRRELKVKETQSDLAKCRDVLKELEDNLGIIPLNGTQTEKSFEELSTRVHQLAKRFLSSPLPPPIVTCLMRVALGEALIAQVLCTNIFRDFDDSRHVVGVDLDKLTGIINLMAQTHPSQAVIIRCQVAKICSDSINVATVAGKAAERVADILAGWLGPKKQSFLTQLEALFSDALKLWRPLQRSPKRITARADLSGEFWFWDEDKRSAYDQVDNGPSENEGERMTSTIDGPLVVLFPQIVADGEDPLFQGCALFHTQHAVMAAAREQSSHQTLRRRRPSRNQPRSAPKPDASPDTTGHGYPLGGPLSDVSYGEVAAPPVGARRAN
ncbi:hypothetical protein OQA88_13443 [Cercophora sp. LCS_1]